MATKSLNTLSGVTMTVLAVACSSATIERTDERQPVADVQDPGSACVELYPMRLVVSGGHVVSPDTATGISVDRTGIAAVIDERTMIHFPRPDQGYLIELGETCPDLVASERAMIRSPMTAADDMMVCAGANTAVNIYNFQCTLASVVKLEPDELGQGFGVHFPNPGNPVAPPSRGRSQLTFRQEGAQR